MTKPCKPMIDDDGEAPELDEAFFRQARRGRPPMPEDCRKQRVTLYLDPDVVAYFKRGGSGWQTRINTALKELSTKH
ncbi:MAG: hypothetical protein A2516_01470 [Alphaproteobacteria bacterium RIFOXYD12_FULL_60_8]|nr:MAG: hypothetical protein A2516_01470 [Alphaproteobacteria bacterium RIFOXYD12_FULL_60_8]